MTWEEAMTEAAWIASQATHSQIASILIQRAEFLERAKAAESRLAQVGNNIVDESESSADYCPDREG